MLDSCSGVSFYVLLDSGNAFNVIHQYLLNFLFTCRCYKRCVARKMNHILKELTVQLWLKMCTLKGKKSQHLLMLEVEGTTKFGKHASCTCQEAVSSLQADVLGIFLVPSFFLRLRYELALAQRTLRCSVLWELSIYVSCLLYNTH